MGNVAFLTPFPKKPRRPTVGADPQPIRPLWADAHSEKARKDFGAFEKRMVCRVYYNLEKLPRENGGPIEKNPEWFAENPDGPVRKIVAELCGVGRTAVGKYLKEHKEGEGVLRSALSRGRVKKTRGK